MGEIPVLGALSPPDSDSLASSNRTFVFLMKPPLTSDWKYLSLSVVMGYQWPAWSPSKHIRGTENGSTWLSLEGSVQREGRVNPLLIPPLSPETPHTILRQEASQVLGENCVDGLITAMLCKGQARPEIRRVLRKMKWIVLYLIGLTRCIEVVLRLPLIDPGTTMRHSKTRLSTLYPYVGVRQRITSNNLYGGARGPGGASCIIISAQTGRRNHKSAERAGARAGVSSWHKSSVLAASVFNPSGQWWSINVPPPHPSPEKSVWHGMLVNDNHCWKGLIIRAFQHVILSLLRQPRSLMLNIRWLY